MRSMDEMQTELIEDLTAELTITDACFNSDLLTVKVKNAIKDVKRARNYPSSYTDEMINADIVRYYAQARAIALYDYNQVGAENEESHSENNISRSFLDRNKLFAGITPFSRVI